ncbi:hypothetical protein VN12_22255 [Pirellula sp. SH-Sr6A]|uniref:hypothetical protein n=1 Tax=Pirellula sp. SH-Sr6A TaxID=1632865 RepID=UPI00078C3BED|nr:hypothetical protein [Pirellula sp. SH-Sr6A]AMV34866.1 hypothetical protein VN12_22255 [Pirellula sp. SH-Sr6A]
MSLLESILSILPLLCDVAPVQSLIDFVAKGAALGELLRIQGYDETPTPWGMIAAGAIGSFMVILAVWKSTVTFITWYQKPINSPKRLFVKLLKVHRLNRLECAMVRQVASGLPSDAPPSILFVDPMYWHTAAPKTGDERLRREVFRKVFNTDLDRYESVAKDAMAKDSK